MLQMQLQDRNVKQTNLQSAVSSVPGDQHSAEFLPGPASEGEQNTKQMSAKYLTLFYENPGSAPSAFFIHPHGTLRNTYRWRFQHFESPIRFSCHQKRFSTSLCCNAALILSSILKRITRKNREEQSKTWHKLNRLLGINVKCYVSCLRNLLTMTIFLKLRDGRNIYLYIESRA